MRINKPALAIVAASTFALAASVDSQLEIDRDGAPAPKE